MKRSLLAVPAAALLIAGLAGCGTSAVAASTPASSSTPKPAPAPTAAGLEVAAQGYDSAMLAGNILGVMAYVDPECSDADRGEAAIAAGLFKQLADGATYTVDSVTVTGDTGRVATYHLSPGAPDALSRELISSYAAQAAQPPPWRYVDGQWYFHSSSCTASASPSPSA